MIPYIVVYLVSFVLVWLAIRKKEIKWLYRLLVSVSLLLPSLLAGFRNYGVGTDTMVYGQRYFEYAHRMSIPRFFEITDCEWGYGLLVFGVSHFTNNIFWMYFLIQLIIMVFVWLSIEEYLDDYYKPYALMVYYLLFYSFSLNLMRQTIAMAIMLFSFRYIRRNKLIPFLICLAAAILFHKTSVISFVLFPIYQLSYTKDKNEIKQRSIVGKYIHEIITKIRKPLLFLGVVAVFLIVLNGARIITFLHFYLDDFYAQYNNLKAGGGNTWRYNLFMIPLLLFTGFSIKKNNPDYIFYIVISVIQLIMFRLKLISTESYRMCLYFAFFMVICLPKNIEIMNNPNNRRISRWISMAIMWLYWYVFFVVIGYNQTHPYVSSILHIGR